MSGTNYEWLWAFRATRAYSVVHQMTLTHLKKGPRNRIFRWSSSTSSDFGHEKPAYSVESQKNPISASYFSRVDV
jgi:hypothetical protein